MTGVVERHDWTDETRGFVVSTFAASYRKASGIVNNGAFRTHVVGAFETALNGSGLLVLALDGAPDEFVGWALVQGDALIYVYVKQAYRHRGFAKRMLPNGLTRVVFQTAAGVGLQRARYGRPLQPAPFALLDAVA